MILGLLHIFSNTNGCMPFGGEEVMFGLAHNSWNGINSVRAFFQI
jgi:hypothetical protein